MYFQAQPAGGRGPTHRHPSAPGRAWVGPQGVLKVLKDAQ